MPRTGTGHADTAGPGPAAASGPRAAGPTPAAVRLPGGSGAGKIVYSSSMAPQQTVPGFEAGFEAGTGILPGCHRTFLRASLPACQWQDLVRAAVAGHRVPGVSPQRPAVGRTSPTARTTPG